MNRLIFLTALAAPALLTAQLTDHEQRVIATFKKAAPSVVHITTLANVSERITMKHGDIPRGVGTGLIWDNLGHIVTNYHVVAGSKGSKVTLADQSIWEAKLIGVDPETELAVLRISAPAQQLPPLEIGTSANLSSGQTVIAIGNPFGLDQTITTGVISGLGREITSISGTPIQGVIQTDASINPGNSGGPLLNSSGQLIGINTAIVSPSGAFAGIGFAVPVDTAIDVVPQLIAIGRVVRPRLGVTYAESPLARAIGVKRGVLILEVTPGMGAEKAKLLPTRRKIAGRIGLGDVIIAINGVAVNEPRELTAALNKQKPGKVVSLTILRDGKERRVDVQLLERSSR